MKNDITKVLDDFIEADETKTTMISIDNTAHAKKVVLDEREGLIERVDRIFVTADGKQLLREQY
jgi:hypothetical protein